MAKLIKLLEQIDNFFKHSSKKRYEKCEKLKKIVKKLKQERQRLMLKNKKKSKQQIDIIDAEIKIAEEFIDECQN